MGFPQPSTIRTPTLIACRYLYENSFSLNNFNATYWQWHCGVNSLNFGISRLNPQLVNPNDRMGILLCSW